LDRQKRCPGEQIRNHSLLINTTPSEIVNFFGFITKTIHRLKNDEGYLWTHFLVFENIRFRREFKKFSQITGCHCPML
jgi:hypothetical protein